MTELVLLAAIGTYAFALGRRVLEWFRVEYASRAGSVAGSTALGLGLLAYIVFVMGQFKCLNVLAVLATGLGALAVVYLPWPLVRKEQHFESDVKNRDRSKVSMSRPRLVVNQATPPGLPRWFSGLCATVFLVWDGAASGAQAVEPPTQGRGRRAHLLVSGIVRCVQFGVVTVTLIGTLISALAPPTAGDALCYHLEIPKRFVQLGEVCYLPLTDNSLFPFLMEMLYTLGLLLHGPVLAQLLHWLVGVLFALAVVELATPILGARAGGWAAVVALLVPGITNQMTAPLNDLAVALYSTLMVIAWTRWNETLQNRWLILSGIFGGFGLSVKLVTAAMVIVLLIATILQEWSRRGSAAMWKAVTTLAGCMMLTAGIWYARSWYYLGNPIYPYFNGFFGLDAHTHSTLIATRNPVTLPWLATMHPEEFGGRGVQFGAVFLALLPGLVLLPRRAPELGRLLVLALGVGVFWFALRQDLRFLLPVVPMLAIASVAVVCTLRELQRAVFVMAAGCVTGLLLFQTLIVVKRARPCVAVALGRESRAEYLRRHEPSYAVAEFVNTQLPPDCRVISQDYRGLYFEPQFVREAALRRRVPYVERGDELAQFLAASGFTHVLLVHAHNPETAVYDQGFAERLGLAVDRLPLVMESHFKGPSGDRRDYRLLELPTADVRLSEKVDRPVHRALRGIAN